MVPDANQRPSGANGSSSGRLERSAASNDREAHCASGADAAWMRRDRRATGVPRFSVVE